MKSSINKLPGSRVEIEIEIPAEEFHSFFDRTVSKLGKNLEINGFRKGKAPKDVIIQHFGQSEIMKEAALDAIKTSYAEIIEEKELEPIGQPQVEIMSLALNNPLKFKILVSVLPPVVLPDYKEIAGQVKRREIKLNPEEVEKTLIQLQKSRAKFTIKNGICQKGDWVEVEINIKPVKKEEKIEISKPKVKDSFILGEGHLLPNIEKEIVGMKAGETKDFSFIYPPNYYQANLANKKVLCHLELKSVQRVDLPDISDDFARGLGHFKSLSDLRNSIKEGILMEKEQQESQRLQQEILDKIVKEVEIDIPKVLIEKEKERMLNQLKKDVSSQLKIRFDNYLKQIGKTEKEVADSFLPVITKRIKEFLILKEIGKKEKIEIDDREVDEKVSQILSQQVLFGNKNIKDTVDLDQLKAYTKEEIFNSRTLKRLESYSSKNKSDSKLNNN